MNPTHTAPNGYYPDGTPHPARPCIIDKMPATDSENCIAAIVYTDTGERDLAPLYALTPLSAHCSPAIADWLDPSGTLRHAGLLVADL